MTAHTRVPGNDRSALSQDHPLPLTRVPRIRLCTRGIHVIHRYAPLRTAPRTTILGAVLQPARSPDTAAQMAKYAMQLSGKRILLACSAETVFTALGPPLRGRSWEVLLRALLGAPGNSCVALCTAIHAYTRVYTGNHRVYTCIHGATRGIQLYSATRGITAVGAALHGCTAVYTAIHGYTRLYTAIHGYTRLYTAIQPYTAVHGCTAVFLDKPTVGAAQLGSSHSGV